MLTLLAPLLLRAACHAVSQVTLQYCLWDQWKEVAATEPRRLLCLAGLVGHLLAAFVLPLSAVKPVSRQQRDTRAARRWRAQAYMCMPAGTRRRPAC